jgi:hypothetical protein
VQVGVSWLQDRLETYQTLSQLWASQDFIAKSKRARECRGSSGPGHSYGPDGHLHLSKRMVRKICMILHLEFIYGTNSYPQELESSVWPSDIKVWKRGHRDPSNPDQLCTLVAQV